MSGIFTFGVMCLVLSIVVLAPLTLGVKNKLMSLSFYEGFKVTMVVGFSLMVLALAQTFFGAGGGAAH